MLRCKCPKARGYIFKQFYVVISTYTSLHNHLKTNIAFIALCLYGKYTVAIILVIPAECGANSNSGHHFGKVQFSVFNLFSNLF